jgi:hypothetical protein
MNPGRNKLLTVAQKLDLLAGAAVRSNQVGGNLRKWRECPKWNRALGSLAYTRENVPAHCKAFGDQIFNRDCGNFV